MTAEQRCPMCGHPPRVVLDNGHQAFCENDECRLIQFDATRTYTDEELAAATSLDLPDWLT